MANLARETAQNVIHGMLADINREIAEELSYEQDYATECYVAHLRERRDVLLYMLEVTK